MDSDLRTGTVDTERFAAPRWLRSAHVQTLGVTFPFWAPPRSFRQGPEHARIPLPGGGSLHARVFWQDEPRPAILLVHGLGGTSQSLYIVRAAVALFRAGYHVVCLDVRGAGEGLADAPSLYHAGLTEDLAVTAKWAAADPRTTTVAVVGFSLGGHVAVRFAGEVGDAPGCVSGVVAISAPLDLHKATQSMERVVSLPYHLYLIRHLVRQGQAFARAHPDKARFDPSRLRRLRRIRAYDETVVAPMHGFASAADYYRRAEAGPFVRHIRVPTLLLHAEDDPMVPPSCVRPWLDKAPSAVEQVWTDRGGHIGWFGGFGERDWVDTWAMRKVREFLRRVAPFETPDIVGP
jgi:predicted alpha/beta-fold hydrolase